MNEFPYILQFIYMIKYFTSLAQEFSNDFYSRFRVGEIVKYYFFKKIIFPPMKLAIFIKKGINIPIYKSSKRKEKLKKKLLKPITYIQPMISIHNFEKI